ncbi:hypothetical protein AVDCRST_MAG81-2982 [uncultured Synechococcales cyanobacterium]|uniref:Uncharacterized protein n=1 Tax=uncultured Synechococcales cyanobacterium TaxID=1936017 RepID=A0A6J4V9G3_9CYAN|nr:hypothetical protein AVDCRST_MAG81-2982 [uncultured Synechococcales cyanobacterium]
MDSLQKQVFILSHKIDALHQKVDQIRFQLAEALPHPILVESTNQVQSETRESQEVYTSNETAHKHVLADENYFDPNGQSNQKVLAPEVQIQRLTAQLIAAYGRIANLEEQLLAQRTH